MLASRSLRRAEPRIASGRQQLIPRVRVDRHFSINATTSYAPRPTRPLPSFRHNVAQQSRSISLFGWGGSSKGPTDSASSSVTTSIDSGPSTAGLDNVRTIKATHGTSDAPDLSQAHFRPPSDIEPQFIENLQETITLPHGNASERIAEIASGAADISTTPERMGYLKEVCGLDFGWGPSTVMENLLEWFHVGMGLSWTASIIAVGVLLRVAMVQAIVGSQKQGQKMREMAPYMKPIREQYLRAMQERDQAKAQQLGLEMKELTKASGVSYTKAFVPMLIQLPFSFGAFRVLRNAGQLPVPAFVTENWLWTTDLSFSDPYFLTPAISAAAIFFTFRLQQKGQQTTMFGPEMMKIFGTALPVLSFIFMSWQPGSVQLYFMTTGLLAYGTTALLRQQWFRGLVGLGPLETGSVKPAITPAATASKIIDLPIQRIIDVPPNPKPIQREEEPKVDKSRIDKVVDGVKDHWKGLIKSTDSTKSVFTSKMQDMQKKKQKESEAAYEAHAKQAFKRLRDARNEEARKQNR